jgi:hypothetical protein
MKNMTYQEVFNSRLNETGLDALAHWPRFKECWYVEQAIIDGVEPTGDRWLYVCDTYYQDELAGLERMEH